MAKVHGVAARSSSLAYRHTEGSEFRGKGNMGTSHRRLKFGGIQLGLVFLKLSKRGGEMFVPPDPPLGV